VLRLADTSVRLYRKRDWSVAVRLHTYLMIHCRNSGFRLAAYLNQFDCTITLEDSQRVPLGDYGYTDEYLFRMDHMIHEFWAVGSAHLDSIADGAALLQIEYRVFSFPGQGSPDRFEAVVPTLARGRLSERSARRPSNAA
jgi:hypothetical protein